MDRRRKALLARARKLKAETLATMEAIRAWNRANPGAVPIDPDPAGQLSRLLESLEFTLACEDRTGGAGPLEPLDIPGARGGRRRTEH